MSKNLIVIVSCLLLLGCCGVSAASSQIFTSEGKKGYSLNCSGKNRNWGHCYQKAGNICKERGYDVLEVTGESGTVTSVKSATGMSTATTDTVYNRIMIIQCKFPDLVEDSSLQSFLN